jgi:hypothetical protein
MTEKELEPVGMLSNLRLVRRVENAAARLVAIVVKCYANTLEKSKI